MNIKRSYVMVLPVPGYRVAPNRFAMESAFVHHLRLLRNRLGPLAETMVLAAPFLDEAAYREQRSHLAEIDELAEGIRFEGMFPLNIRPISYYLRLPAVMRRLYIVVKDAAIVHSSNSQLYRPFEFPALLMATARGAKTISVTDIDSRNSARMNLLTGRWSRRNYVVTRLIHDSFSHLQQVIGVRTFSLVLLKGSKMATDYGRGRKNVKNFLDSAFSDEHIIPTKALEAKLSALADPHQPLRLNYFGRLVAYKGIDHMLRALHHAISLGTKGIVLEIIGGGPEKSKLEALTKELSLGEAVIFREPVPFGAELFAYLHRNHVLLAAPLSEDTPRSALDAMASGQTLIAYDTYYYSELATTGAPIELVPWRDIEKLGNKIYEVAARRTQLAGMIGSAVHFARCNTQEVWLDRRVEWTRQLFENGSLIAN